MMTEERLLEKWPYLEIAKSILNYSDRYPRIKDIFVGPLEFKILYHGDDGYFLSHPAQRRMLIGALEIFSGDSGSPPLIESKYVRPLNLVIYCKPDQALDKESVEKLCRVAAGES